MVATVINGFPRIGENRELKKVLEQYWSGAGDFSQVSTTAKELRARHWKLQKDAGIDVVSVGDFSLYDTVLDTIHLLGAIPTRFRGIGDATERYFAMARGTRELSAMEMTKWFNTNYHYIVPELTPADTFKLDPSKLLGELAEARALGLRAKIQVLGPVSFLRLSKRQDGGDALELLGKILPLYEELVKDLVRAGAEYLQFDEPSFVRDPDSAMLKALPSVYDRLANAAQHSKLIVTTYFEHSNEATEALAATPVWGIGLDFVHGPSNFDGLERLAKTGSIKGKTIVAGLVDGRNVWVADIESKLALLRRIAEIVGDDKVIVAPSSSLLHVPYTVSRETKLDAEIKSWLSFAKEKLDETVLLARAWAAAKSGNGDRDASLAHALEENRARVASRKNSPRIHKSAVQQRIASLKKVERADVYADRIEAQRRTLNYPRLATTTIGSFPQTPELRKLRQDLKTGTVDTVAYDAGIRSYIDQCVAFQEEIGLDVLVHGEPERNDMVEYFGEQLDGFVFSSNGWVQSYGSRCVKPPLIYGDVSRPKAMTVDTIRYAQSRTSKVMKGMLTGPVTILNWSFVRDDLPRSKVSEQIAVALSDEVSDLQDAGIRIIQVDEAAFKEGYPLRAANIPIYEGWAVRDFKLAVSPAKKETQIHTHMCYSDFNDAIKTIEAMDADVISIETTRSGNELLKVFKGVGYRQEIGPGIYDIHSPRVPSEDEMVAQIRALLEVLPARQLWINPDCGLKTRKWEEVKPSLTNLVAAVRKVKAEAGL